MLEFLKLGKMNVGYSPFVDVIWFLFVFNICYYFVFSGFTDFEKKALSFLAYLSYMAIEFHSHLHQIYDKVK